MSLADELLADLDDIGDELENNDNEKVNTGSNTDHCRMNLMHIPQEDEVMEATAEASSITNQSVQAFAQLANSDRVRV